MPVRGRGTAGRVRPGSAGNRCFSGHVLFPCFRVRHEASDGLHRFGNLPREIAVHNVVVSETQDHVPATQELAVALQVLLALFFRRVESPAVHLDDDEVKDDHVDLPDPLDPHSDLRSQPHVDELQPGDRLEDRACAVSRQADCLAQMGNSAARNRQCEGRYVVQAAVARGIKHRQRHLERHADEHALQHRADTGDVCAPLFLAHDLFPMDAYVVEAA